MTMPHRGSAHGPPPPTGQWISRFADVWSQPPPAATRSAAARPAAARPAAARPAAATLASPLRRRAVRSRLAAALLTLLSWSVASDQAALAQLPTPRLDALFPPVVQRGAATRLRVTAGQNLDPPQRWLFSDERLNALPVLAETGDPYAIEPALVPDQLLVEVAEDARLGPVHLWCGSRFGISNPRPLLVVDRPVAVDLTATADSDTAPLWPLEQWLVGQCTPQAVDHWRLPAERATELHICAHIAQLDSQLSPVLEVVTADGRLIATERGGRGSDVSLSVPVTPAEPLLLRVRDTTYLGGAMFAYALSAEPTRAGQSPSSPEVTISLDAADSPKTADALETAVDGPTAIDNLPEVADWGSIERPWQVPAVVQGTLGGPEQIEELHWISPQAGTVVFDLMCQRAGEVADPLMLVQLGRQDEAGGWSWHDDKIVDDLDPLPELLGLRRHRDPRLAIQAAAGQRIRVRLRNNQSLPTGSEPRYRLEARSPRRDLQVHAWTDLAAEQRVPQEPLGIGLRRGQRLAVRVLIDPQDGFFDPISTEVELVPGEYRMPIRLEPSRYPVRILVDGLPPGIVSHGLELTDWQRIGTLILEAQVEPEAELDSWSGPVRLRAEYGPAESPWSLPVSTWHIRWGAAPRTGPAALASGDQFAVALVAQETAPIACRLGLPPEPAPAEQPASAESPPAESPPAESPPAESPPAENSPAETAAGPAIRLPSEPVRLTANQPLRLLVQLQRQPGAAGAVTVRLRDLPPGCQAEPITIAADANQGELVMAVGESLTPGRYRLHATIESPVSYVRNPQAVERAEQELNRLRELAARLTDGGEPIPDALTNRLSAEEATLAAAQQAAQPKQLTHFDFSQPIDVVIDP
jgi:hypothetical protein